MNTMLKVIAACTLIIWTQSMFDPDVKDFILISVITAVAVKKVSTKALRLHLKYRTLS